MKQLAESTTHSFYCLPAAGVLYFHGHMRSNHRHTGTGIIRAILIAAFSLAVGTAFVAGQSAAGQSPTGQPSTAREAAAEHGPLASTRISLVTILPGKALYSSFGHTAIRIIDRRSGADTLYNYGLSADPFDLRFAIGMFAGRMNFMVGAGKTERALAFYREVENRSIVEQVLDLSEAQKRSLISSLRHDTRPENRVYNYRYFSDNCTTRVAVMLEDLSGDSRADDPVDPSRTLRVNLNEVLAERPWLRFVIGTLIGPAVDAPPAPGDPLFLPAPLYDWAAGARNLRWGGAPFVSETIVLYEKRPEEKPRRWFTPITSALLILAAALSFPLISFTRRKSRHDGSGNEARSGEKRRRLERNRNREKKSARSGVRKARGQARGQTGSGRNLRQSGGIWAGIFDIFLCVVSLMVGAAILLFWFLAGYQEIAWNLNLLWASPLPLAALILLRAARRLRKSGAAARVIFLITAVCAFMLALTGGLGLQSIEPAPRILAMAIALRCADRGGLFAQAAKVLSRQPR